MLLEGEVVLHEDGASHFHNFIAIGGTLKLTNMRLLFNSHKARNINHHLEIDIKDIAAVELFKTLLINPNGIALLLKNGNIENFIVDDRKSWQERIMSCQMQMI